MSQHNKIFKAIFQDLTMSPKFPDKFPRSRWQWRNDTGTICVSWVTLITPSMTMKVDGTRWELKVWGWNGGWCNEDMISVWLVSSGTNKILQSRGNLIGIKTMCVRPSKIITTTTTITIIIITRTMFIVLSL